MPKRYVSRKSSLKGIKTNANGLGSVFVSVIGDNKCSVVNNQLNPRRPG
jgi:hypothetical protein